MGESPRVNLPVNPRALGGALPRGDEGSVHPSAKGVDEVALQDRARVRSRYPADRLANEPQRENPERTEEQAERQPLGDALDDEAQGAHLRISRWACVRLVSGPSKSKLRRGRVADPRSALSTAGCSCAIPRSLRRNGTLETARHTHGTAGGVEGNESGMAMVSTRARPRQESRRHHSHSEDERPPRRKGRPGRRSE